VEKVFSFPCFLLFKPEGIHFTTLFLTVVNFYFYFIKSCNPVMNIFLCANEGLARKVCFAELFRRLSLYFILFCA
jgi:hypothetical protein